MSTDNNDPIVRAGQRWIDERGIEVTIFDISLGTHGRSVISYVDDKLTVGYNLGSVVKEKWEFVSEDRPGVFERINTVVDVGDREATGFTLTTGDTK